MSASPKWLELAEQLLAAVPERDPEASYAEERLDWRIGEVVRPFVQAAKAKAEGVKAKDRRDWPRILGDEPITGWMTQEYLASVVGRDVRTVRRWERRGLPVYGEGKSLRYPRPHAVTWAMAYMSFRAKGKRVHFLPLEIARGEQQSLSAHIAAGRKLDIGR